MLSLLKTLTNHNYSISDKIAAVKRIAEIVAISSYDTEAEMKEKDRLFHTFPVSVQNSLLIRHTNTKKKTILCGTRNPIARHCYSSHE